MLYADTEARTCLACPRPFDRTHGRRGLCVTCYRRELHQGRHVDYERQFYANEELVEEWLWLRVEGYTRRQVAERLGVKPTRLEKALQRGRKRGAITREQSLALPTLGKVARTTIGIGIDYH